MAAWREPGYPPFSSLEQMLGPYAEERQAEWAISQDAGPVLGTQWVLGMH